MIYLDKLYALREKIPQSLRKILPKLIRRKINQKFFCYYFLPTKLKSLPILNYPDKESYEYQKNLIHKFDLEKKQTSFMTYPNLIDLLKKNFDINYDIKFLDIGGERIDFYLDLNKNFKNIEYYIFNIKSMIEPFREIKSKFNYKNFHIIEKVEDIFKLNFNFINFGSCIQYFDKYEKLLNEITDNSDYIFFSGTHLYDTMEKKFEKHIIVKQVNLLPNENFLYLFNRKNFFQLFYKKNFKLVFEEENLTDKINYDNFKKDLINITYSDFLFKKK